MAPPSHLPEIMLALLRDRPDEWANEYRCLLRHVPTGYGVWIGNGHYGLSIRDRENSEIYGGVSLFSVLFGRFIPWRVRLLREAREWLLSRDFKVILDHVRKPKA